MGESGIKCLHILQSKKFLDSNIDETDVETAWAGARLTGADQVGLEHVRF